MPSKQLANLARIGKLKIERPAKAEVDGLVRSGSIRLKDATNDSISRDSKFDLAYNAAHALALAALRWHGYRSESRFLVFQCLEHTLEFEPLEWRVLDEAHRKRNIAEYEGELDIDDALVEALIRAAKEIGKRVRALKPLTDDATK
jgi:hypothetical protein